MDRTIISWNIPNMITIWLMLIGLVLLYAVGAQVAVRAGWAGGGSTTANNSGGY